MVAVGVGEGVTVIVDEGAALGVGLGDKVEVKVGVRV
jgi:hypothetical protein